MRWETCSVGGPSFNSKGCLVSNLRNSCTLHRGPSLLCLKSPAVLDWLQFVIFYSEFHVTVCCSPHSLEDVSLLMRNERDGITRGNVRNKNTFNASQFVHFSRNTHSQSPSFKQHTLHEHVSERPHQDGLCSAVCVQVDHAVDAVLTGSDQITQTSFTV